MLTEDLSDEAALPTGSVVERMSRDLASASESLSPGEARFLVDSYYTMQENRIRTDAQVRVLGETGEPHAVLEWLTQQNTVVEKQIARALDKYSAASPLGSWARSIVGIGPVIAAGLLSYVDMTKCSTAGALWRYAGLDPTNEWLGKDKARKLFEEVVGTRGKATPEQIATIAVKTHNKPVEWIERLGELSREEQISYLAKRPWSGQLKTLCWKIGESFIKQQSRDGDYYGKVYVARKAQESARNEAGAYADQAAGILERKRIGKATDAYAAYSVGKLPPAHIHARARRYAVKLFLAHYHEKGYELVLGKKAPTPYPIAFLEHSDYIPPPN